MNKVQLTPQASLDLIEIKNYISIELKNPSAAKGIVSRITKKLHILKKHPLAGPSVEALTGVSTNLRILVCDKHIAIYRVEGNIISIARVINAKQDYMRILFGETEL